MVSDSVGVGNDIMQTVYQIFPDVNDFLQTGDHCVMPGYEIVITASDSWPVSTAMFCLQDICYSGAPKKVQVMISPESSIGPWYFRAGEHLWLPAAYTRRQMIL